MKAKQGFVWAMIICLILTAACSSKGAVNSPAEPTPTAGATPAESGQETPEATNEGEKTIDFSEKMKIEYARQFQQSFDEPPIGENPIKQQIEKDLNIEYKVSVTAGNYDGFSQILTTRVATSDLPDVAWVNTSDMFRLAEQGVLVPLDDMLEYFPKLKASRSEEEWLLSTVNGNIYGVSRTQALGAMTASYIRKDWLDNLNLQVPTTTDEFFEVLRAFTFDDPDRNGKQDTIGYTAYHLHRVSQGMIANAFGLPQIGIHVGGVPDDWIDKDGVLHFGPTSEQYKQYLMYFHKLNEAKVIDPDLPTNTNQTSQQKIIQGQAGVFGTPNPQNWMFESNPRLLDPILEADANANWILLDPIKGPEGHSGHNTVSVSAPWHLVVFDKKDQARAERSLALINYMDNGSGELGGEMLNFGIKEIHTETVDGKLQIKQEFTDMKNKYVQAYNMSKIEPDLAFQDFIFTEKDKQEFDRIIDNYNRSVTMVNGFYGVLPFAYDGDKYVEEMGLRFMYGRDSFDKWDEYVTTLNERYRYNEVKDIRKAELIKVGLLK